MAGTAQKNVMGIIESSIGGSPICEAVKQIADVLFESSFDDYDDNDNVENDDDEDFAGKLYGSEEDRISDQYGVPMSIVGEEHVRTLDPDQRKREDREDAYERQQDEIEREDKEIDDRDYKEMYNDTKRSLRKLVAYYGNKQIAIKTCKDAMGKFVLAVLSEYMDGEYGKQKMVKEFKLSPEKLDKIVQLVENAEKESTINAVANLFQYGTQKITLRTKSLDMAANMNERNKADNSYYVNLECPYVIVDGVNLEAAVPSCQDMLADIAWYNRALRKMPISQKLGGNVSITPAPENMDNVYDFQSSIINVVLNNLDRLVASNTMAGNGLDVDGEPLDIRRKQFTTDADFDDFRETHSDNSDDDYYDAYKGSSDEADAMIAQYDEDELKRRMSEANKGTSIEEDLKRWGY